MILLFVRKEDIHSQCKLIIYQRLMRIKQFTVIFKEKRLIDTQKPFDTLREKERERLT